MMQLRAAQVVALMILMTVAAQYIHEIGHWSFYQALGRQPVWGFIGLVQVWGEAPVDQTGWTPTVSRSGEPGWLRISSALVSPLEEGLAAAGGPMASVLGVVFGLVLARRSRNEAYKAIGVGLVLTTAVAMVLYYVRSPWRNGGDEQDIVDVLGMARWPLDLGLGLYFAICCGIGLRELKTRGPKLLWMVTALVSGPLVGILLAVADGAVRQGAARGNPLFADVLGFSLPVALVGVGCVVLLWVWSQWPRSSATPSAG